MSNSGRIPLLKWSNMEENQDDDDDDDEDEE